MDDQRENRRARWWQFAIAIALLPSAVICWLLALGIAAGPGQHYSDFWQLVVMVLLGAGVVCTIAAVSWLIALVGRRK